MMDQTGLTGICPFCKYTVDAAVAVEEGMGEPSPGDLTLCIRCGEFVCFDADMSLRKPNSAEYERIGSSEQCRMLRSAWVNMEAERSRTPVQEESILDTEFAAIETKIIGMTNGDNYERSVASKVAKAFFALGAMSVFDVMSPKRSKGDPAKSAALFRRYRADLEVYMKGRNGLDK